MGSGLLFRGRAARLSGAPAFRAPAALPERAWYIAQLRPNGLSRAERNLARQGYPVFMPRRRETWRRGTRHVTGERPLFPGYLFVRIDLEGPGFRPVNATYGVTRLVALDAGLPTPVPDQLMDELRGACRPDDRLRPPSGLRAGQSVRLVAGPFAGALARLEAAPERERVFLLLDLMGTSIRASVPVADLEVVETVSPPGTLPPRRRGRRHD